MGEKVIGEDEKTMGEEQVISSDSFQISISRSNDGVRV